MGSGSKKTSTTRTKKPQYIDRAARQASSLASQYAARPYEEYTGERVAPLSQNEQLAGERARAGMDIIQPALNQASQRFTDADMTAYMNPYIKGALDPAARELRQQGAAQLEDVRGQMASRGAFSGSRALLAERQTQERTDQAISDLYGRGYAEAFESGANRWAADQDRALKVAGLGADAISAEVRNLMMTGEAARRVEQGRRDFDYGQFIEGRDWDAKNAGIITNVLQGLRGSYSESETTTTKQKGSVMGQILGAATTIGAAYFTGGASLFASGAAGAAGAAGATAGNSYAGALIEAGAS